MSRLGWAGTAILVGLMASIEFVEGHGLYVAMIVSGSVGILAWSRCRGGRLRAACGWLGCGVFFVLGLVHWCDGRTEIIDWVSLCVVILLTGIVLGRFHWLSRRGQAWPQPKR